MALSATESCVSANSLPQGAPRVLITAGAGSAGEKTWNLRHPVTLIGSQRKAHIVLHGSGIGRVHCVIVNTGSEVFLKDLHTVTGTQCNGVPVTCQPLRRGDVIAVGQMEIHVEIQASPGRPAQVVAPLPNLPGRASQLDLLDEQTGRRWRLRSSIDVVGQAPDAEIRLQGAGVEPAHAVVFRMGAEVFLYDLIAGDGPRTDGDKAAIRALTPGETVEIGPCRLRVVPSAPPKAPTGVEEPKPREQPSKQEEPTSSDSPPPSGSASETQRPIARSLTELQDDIASIQQRIGETWESLNESAADAVDSRPALVPSKDDLFALATQLNQREAAVRGFLHDMTRCHEQLVRWEKELAARAARIHDERLKLYQDQASWAKRKAEIARRASELDRRERTLREGGGG
jgi:pSer/pThr/pTyr-binding forkhead associated (FHA) protein